MRAEKPEYQRGVGLNLKTHSKGRTESTVRSSGEEIVGVFLAQGTEATGRCVAVEGRRAIAWAGPLRGAGAEAWLRPLWVLEFVLTRPS